MTKIKPTPPRAVLLSGCVVLLVLLLPIDGACKNGYVLLERPTIDLGFEYDFETEKREGPNKTTEDTSHEFSEWLDVATNGWLYHPDLVEFGLRFRPQFDQSAETHSFAESGSDAGLSGEYDIQATFLRAKPYSLYAFARKENRSLRSAYARSSDIDSEDYGAELRLKNRYLPSTFGFTHRSIEQSGFFNSNTTSDDARFSANHRTDKSNSYLRANYNDQSRSVNGTSTQVQSANGSIRNYLELAEDDKLTLNSSLTHRWSSSDASETTGSMLSESLFWTHGKTLRSRYQGTFSRSTHNAYTSQNTTLGAGLTHFLFENLTTDLSGHAAFSDYTGGSEDSYSGSLDFKYNRKIPWGHLGIDVGYDYERNRRNLVDQNRQAIDEPHVLVTGQPTFLQYDRVDVASVRVTDQTGAILYSRDIDYRLEPIGDSVRISRTPFGAIESGQEVWVTYRYMSDPSYDDQIFGQSYGVNFNLWSALTLYGAYTLSKQEVTSGPEPDRRVDDAVMRAGMRFQWKWTDTGFSYENADRPSSISTERWMAEETVTLTPLTDVSFVFSGYYGQTNYKDTNDTETFYGARSSLQWGMSRHLRVAMEGFHDTVYGSQADTVDIGTAVVLNLSYGLWNGKVGYRFVNEENGYSGETRLTHGITFKLVRRFW